MDNYNNYVGIAHSRQCQIRGEDISKFHQSSPTLSLQLSSQGILSDSYKCGSDTESSRKSSQGASIPNRYKTSHFRK